MMKMKALFVEYYNIFTKDEAHTFEIVYETWIWIFFQFDLASWMFADI